MWYKEYMKKQGKRVNIRISSEAHEKIKKLCEKKKWSIISVVDELVK